MAYEGYLEAPGVSSANILTFRDLATWSYNNRPASIPAAEGWQVLDQDDLPGVDSDHWGTGSNAGDENNYYVHDFTYGIGIPGLAVARTLLNQDTNTLAISFQGTSSVQQAESWPQMMLNPQTNSDSYIWYFEDLLDAVADYAQENDIADIWISGHSLGAGATNQLRWLAQDGAYFDGVYDDATYVGWATPVKYAFDVDTTPILNIGHHNDIVYEIANAYINKDNSDLSTTNLYYYNNGFSSSLTKSIHKSWDAHWLTTSLKDPTLADYSDDVERLVAAGLGDDPTVTKDRPVFTNGLTVTESVGDSGYSVSIPTNGTAMKGSWWGKANQDAVLLGRINGPDQMVGTKGHDILVGGGGEDILTGGSGNDTFRFAANQENGFGGTTSILDFTLGDELEMWGASLNTPVDYVSGMTIGAGDVAVDWAWWPKATDVDPDLGIATLHVGLDDQDGADLVIKLTRDFKGTTQADTPDSWDYGNWAVENGTDLVLIG